MRRYLLLLRLSKAANALCPPSGLRAFLFSYAVMWFNADKRIHSNNVKRARFLKLESMILGQQEKFSRGRGASVRVLSGRDSKV